MNRSETQSELPRNEPERQDENVHDSRGEEAQAGTARSETLPVTPSCNLVVDIYDQMYHLRGH